MIKYLIHFRSLTLISLYLGAEKRGDRRTERERPRESEREQERKEFYFISFYGSFFYHRCSSREQNAEKEKGL